MSGIYLQKLPLWANKKDLSLQMLDFIGLIVETVVD
jgi:hypothetical protein